MLDLENEVEVRRRFGFSSAALRLMSTGKCTLKITILCPAVTMAKKREFFTLKMNFTIWTIVFPFDGIMYQRRYVNECKKLLLYVNPLWSKHNRKETVNFRIKHFQKRRSRTLMIWLKLVGELTLSTCIWVLNLTLLGLSVDSQCILWWTSILSYRLHYSITPFNYVILCVPIVTDTYRSHLRSADRKELKVPRHNLSTYGPRSFSIAGPTVWNSLPIHPRDENLSYEQFSSGLKSFLFRSSYDL